MIEQKDINETGSIFKCGFNNRQNTCDPFVFDQSGNLVENSLDSRIKDNQMLGFTIDGVGSASEKIVVCGPQFKAVKTVGASDNPDYYLHGICYWKSNTLDNSPSLVNPIKPLRDESLQFSRGIYYYMIAEMGFSLHVTDNSEEVLMGAPGIHNWMGSVIRHKKEIDFDTGSNTGEAGPTAGTRYVTDVIHPELIANSAVGNDSYLGYAVTSGYFLGSKRTELLYVASAPQADGQSGAVYIFSYQKTNSGKFTMRIRQKFESQQMGEYFGYTLLTEDFDNDGLPDLAIGAPMHSKNKYNDNGVVYIFINKGNLHFELQKKLSSDIEQSGRFGTSIAKIGDIDLDGYNDIAIGAPFENDGAVYIFHGRQLFEGKLESTRPSQKLTPSKNDVTTPKNFMFGHSISRGVDLDNNGYNDIAVGAPEGEKVFVYKTYPSGNVDVELRTDKSGLKQKDNLLKVTACWKILSKIPVQGDLGNK